MCFLIVLAFGLMLVLVMALALAVAALRFWLSRLAGPVSGESEGQGSKDPAEFARIFGYRFNALGDGDD